jgi:hypothetical protein
MVHGWRDGAKSYRLDDDTAQKEDDAQKRQK